MYDYDNILMVRLLFLDFEVLFTQHALFLIQEQVDGLLEDLAEMMAEYRQPMTQVEIERLSNRLCEPASLTQNYADPEFSQAARVVEVERFPAAGTACGPA